MNSPLAQHPDADARLKMLESSQAAAKELPASAGQSPASNTQASADPVSK